MTTRQLIHRMVIDDLEADRLEIAWKVQTEAAYMIPDAGEPEDTTLALADGSGDVATFIGAELAGEAT